MWVLDDGMRVRLLRDADLTLNTAIDVCRASERASLQSKAIQAKEEAIVNFIKPKSDRRHTSDSQAAGSVIKCKYCGSKHARVKEKCPAYGKECNHCSKKKPFL